MTSESVRIRTPEYSEYVKFHGLLVYLSYTLCFNRSGGELNLLANGLHKVQLQHNKIKTKTLKQEYQNIAFIPLFYIAISGTKRKQRQTNIKSSQITFLED